MSKIITHIEALEKAKAYCAYQERCHWEVKKKLKGWNLNSDEIDYVILQLMEGNYLNEERFACAFVSGKFRIKKWGRNKIKLQLKQRQISDYCIRKGMEEIEEEEYMKTLNDLVEKKFNSITKGKEYEKKYKTLTYLYNRGFERDLIQDALNDFLAKN